MHFLGANKYMEDNQIPRHYLLIRKQNQVYYFGVEEYYEEYHSLVDKYMV